MVGCRLRSTEIANKQVLYERQVKIKQNFQIAKGLYGETPTCLWQTNHHGYHTNAPHYRYPSRGKISVCLFYLLQTSNFTLYPLPLLQSSQLPSTPSLVDIPTLHKPHKPAGPSISFPLSDYSLPVPGLVVMCFVFMYLCSF